MMVFALGHDLGLFRKHTVEKAANAVKALPATACSTSRGTLFPLDCEKILRPAVGEKDVQPNSGIAGAKDS